MRKALKELGATAYHEAGHAVAFVSHGLAFKRVDIHRKDGRHGFILEPERNEPIGEWDAAAVECSFAGPIAERMHTGRWDWPGASADLDHVIENGWWLDAQVRRMTEAGIDAGGSEGFVHDRAVWSALFISALRVADNWTSVERVAKALLQRKQLDYSEVHDLVIPEEGSPRAPLSRRSLRAVTTRLLFRNLALVRSMEPSETKVEP